MEKIFEEIEAEGARTLKKSEAAEDASVSVDDYGFLWIDLG